MGKHKLDVCDTMLVVFLPLMANLRNSVSQKVPQRMQSNRNAYSKIE